MKRQHEARKKRIAAYRRNELLKRELIEVVGPTIRRLLRG